MANQRSPNCPQISFSDAIEKGRKIYTEEHTHPTAKLVIANDLGYSTINGRSLSMIGALRQYGILEGSAEAMRITDDAVMFYELEDGAERREAIARMAFKPPLFAELKQQFGATPPGEGSLRHSLIKKDFLPKAATDVIRVFKENMELVNWVEHGYSGDDPKPEETTMQTTNNPTTIHKPLPGAQQTYAFALSPDARAELVLRGTITADDLEMLRDHIELTIKALARTAKREAIEQ
jgi:hypothetical protein